MKTLLIILFGFVLGELQAQSTAGYTLVARYPFNSDPKEATGSYGDATVSNVTYAQGGIYSNGIYPGSSSNGTLIQTPQISGFPMDNFLIKLDFNAEALGLPVIVAGNIWRWMSIYTASDATLEVRVNTVNGDYKVFNSTKTLNTGTWYSLGIEFDSTRKSLKIYIDNNEVISATLPASFGYENDFVFTNQHGGDGKAYKGYWKNLEIYKKTASGIFQKASFTYSLYPNPASGEFLIKLPKRASRIEVCDITGRLIKTYAHPPMLLRVEGLDAGVYFCSVFIGGEVVTQKVIIK